MTMKEYIQHLPVTFTTTASQHQWAALVWVTASCTGILTTRLLLTSSNGIAADTLLLLHIILALVLYIYNHGFKIFWCVPNIPLRRVTIPIDVRSRTIASGWIHQLWRALYVVLTTTSLICGYQAVLELQNLPITILLMQVDSFPIDLFMAYVGFAFTSLSARDRNRWLDAVPLGYEVLSIAGFCYFCWQYSWIHVRGVVFAVVSSAAARTATMLYERIAMDIRATYEDEPAPHGFDAVVLVVNALMILCLGRVQFNDANVLELLRNSGPLLLLNTIFCTLAIYTKGGLFRYLRTRGEPHLLHWTSIPISVVWSVVLLVFETVISSTGTSIVESVALVIIMAGKPTIEDSYTALAVLCDGVSARLPQSIP